MNEMPRRTALAGTAAAVGLAAGCARYGEGAAPAPAPTPTPPPKSPGSPDAKPEALTTAADIPVGGGTIFRDQQVVVTQPSTGEFAAFSAVCTHQGCLVSEVADGTINCTCHGSKFKITDGEVTAGPAKRPLPSQALTVDGDQISLA